jgi:hypothetical protein
MGPYLLGLGTPKLGFKTRLGLLDTPVSLGLDLVFLGLDLVSLGLNLVHRDFNWCPKPKPFMTRIVERERVNTEEREDIIENWRI